MSEGTQPALSGDLVRALNHRADLENGDLDARYGVAPSLFASFGAFPLSPPDESKPLWLRENLYGAVSITRGVTADKDGRQQLTRYPSGGLPRLFLIDLATEVLAAHQRGAEHPEWVELGRTLTRYSTDRLGLKKGGSTNRAILEQIMAAARATITFTAVSTDNGSGRRRVQGVDVPRVSDRFDLWLPQQDALDPLEPFIALSPAFVSMVLEGDSIPVRRDLLAQLAGKPMAFDILLWLGRITFALDRSRKQEKFFAWAYLYATFTHDYTRLDRFTAKWKVQLTEAMRYYPDGRVEIIRGSRGKPGGVLVKRSPLLIEPRRGS